MFTEKSGPKMSPGLKDAIGKVDSLRKERERVYLALQKAQSELKDARLALGQAQERLVEAEATAALETGAVDTTKARKAMLDTLALNEARCKGLEARCKGLEAHLGTAEELVVKAAAAARDEWNALAGSIALEITSGFTDGLEWLNTVVRRCYAAALALDPQVEARRLVMALRALNVTAPGGRENLLGGYRTWKDDPEAAAIYKQITAIRAAASGGAVPEEVGETEEIGVQA